MRLIICLCLVLSLALPAVSTAQQGGISLDQAVKQIKNRGDVKVLSATRVNRNGQLMYRIKVVTADGRVKYVWVDPGG
ncbi:MAG TPA: PepSY domain-containing protein [Arenicellales bacterium]|nr:PepSY domain-containing protein [Arenicellales bacterium]